MAMKEINSIIRTATINGEELTFTAKQFKGKRRIRGAWKECVATCGRCSKFKECEWFPENTDGLQTASFSCEGWEPEDKAFSKIDGIVTSMVRVLKGWAEESEIDEEIKKAEKKGK
jgi:hypothetical protein